MIFALVSLHEAVDLIGVVALTALGAFLWTRLRRRDKLRRAARKERLARYEHSRIRTEKEWDEAQRYLGGVVR